jgi:hypothetical protein
MIFKRKQARPADVGTICVINNDVRELMKDSWEYREKSVTFHTSGQLIRGSSLNKNRGLKAMLADATLVYIIEDSIFDGLVKVVPVSIDKDNSNANAVKSLVNCGNSFLIKKDSLSSTSQDFITKSTNRYFSSTFESIASNLYRKYGASFHWVNK